MMNSNGRKRPPSSPQDAQPPVPDAWPPCCCVAAFVAAALEKFGHKALDPQRLARLLGITVGPDCRNPWALPVEPDPERQGVAASGSAVRIPKVLAEFDPRLAFRHLPFSRIVAEQYDAVLEQALRRGCVVAVGFDYGRFSGQQRLLRHVARVEPGSTPESVILLDDCAGDPPRKLTTRWPDLEAAVRAVHDGFWIIGPRPALELDHTPSLNGREQ